MGAIKLAYRCTYVLQLVLACASAGQLCFLTLPRGGCMPSTWGSSRSWQISVLLSPSVLEAELYIPVYMPL